MRLANGPTEYEGIVEAYYKGQWNTVCYDGWILNDAHVVCNELSTVKAISVIQRDAVRSSTLWLTDPSNCLGIKLTGGNCLQQAEENHICSFGYVQCVTGELSSYNLTNMYVLVMHDFLIEINS